MAADNGARTVLGHVIAVQGPVVDVKFTASRDVPNVYDVIETETLGHRAVVLEVAEHLPGNTARCIALNSTLNLQRNAAAHPTGGAVHIPVGHELYGRIINVLGEPIDMKGPVLATEKRPIRRPLAGGKIPQRGREEAPGAFRRPQRRTSPSAQRLSGRPGGSPPLARGRL